MSGRNPPLCCTLTYINRHAGSPNNSKRIIVQYIVKQVVIIYDKNAIEPYNNRGLSQE